MIIGPALNRCFGGSALRNGTSKSVPYLIASVLYLSLLGCGGGLFSDHLTQQADESPPEAPQFSFANATQMPVVNGCALSLSPSSSLSFLQPGGVKTISVTLSGSSCNWRVEDIPSWLSVSPASGTASGTLSATAPQNNSVTRQGTFRIKYWKSGGMYSNHAVVNVSQSGCFVGLNPLSASIGQMGGNGSLQVSTASPSVSWCAASTAIWLGVTPGTGTGAGVLSYSATANTTIGRAATIKVSCNCGGGTQPLAPIMAFSLNQLGAGTITRYLAPTSSRFRAAGGSSTFNVGSPVSWTAAASAPWISINSTSGTTGMGSVSFSVLQNNGSAPRIGQITVTNGSWTLTHTIAQGFYALKTQTSTATYMTPIGGTCWPTEALAHYPAKQGADSKLRSLLLTQLTSAAPIGGTFVSISYGALTETYDGCSRNASCPFPYVDWTGWVSMQGTATARYDVAAP